jgi:periplasmic protein TonB
MIAKKNPKVNPEKDRVVYFQLGLFVTGASLLMAFSWRHPIYDAPTERMERKGEIVELKMAKEELQKPVEIPKIVKVTNDKPVTPDLKIISPDMKEVGNVDKNEKNEVSTLPDVGKIIINIGDEKAPDLEVHKWIDNEASFDSWIPFLVKELKYPSICQEMGIQGKVYVKFIVEKDGSITDAKVANKIDKHLAKEALRVVNLSPKWKPGTLKGEYVRSYKTVVINFTLQ